MQPRFVRMAVPVTFVLCTLARSVPTQTADDNSSLNAPDKVAWQLFLQVNTAGGGRSATFETWASDTDTFAMSPRFPPAPTPLTPRPPVVPEAGRQAIQQGGGLLPQLPPDPNRGEESRRNQAAFDFITRNNLHKLSGLRAAFGTAISFPPEAIEVKANWMRVSAVPAFSRNRVTLANVPTIFHVSRGADGNDYAMVSMHIISKLVPNWTWATFEHTLNPGRCDILGCVDRFGAQTPIVQPNRDPDQGYQACTPSPALVALTRSARWDAAFANYCLKGTQTDFTDTTGLDTRLGNSVTEAGFVNRASCMTCHGRAAFDQNGQATSGAGFDPSGLAPLGPILPTWYWSFTATPPIFVGMPNLRRTATSADFVWSIPFCAIDDAAPSPRTRCSGG